MKYLPRTTSSGRAPCDEAFNIDKNSKNLQWQRVFCLIANNFLDKASVLRGDKYASDICKNAVRRIVQ